MARTSKCKIKWNTIINNLVLIKIGQELGSDSDLSRGLYTVIEIFIHLFSGVIC